MIKQKDAEIASLRKDLEDAIATIKELQGDLVDDESGDDVIVDGDPVAPKKSRK